MKKATVLALFFILAVTIGFYFGRHEYSILAMTDKAKNKFDFTYKVPTYLPKGYKLIRETYSPPRETSFGKGTSIVTGSVTLMYQSHGWGYITFNVQKQGASGGPAEINPKVIKVGNQEILLTKIDQGILYQWDQVGRIRYSLETGKKFPQSEAKKVIASVLK